MIKEQLLEGAKIEKGNFSCRIKNGARRPNWKKVVEEELGEDFVAEVISNTPHDKQVVVEYKCLIRKKK